TKRTISSILQQELCRLTVQRPLQSEQLLLDGQPAAISDQPPVGSDDAVAGDHNGYWIPAVGQSYRARCVRVSDHPGELAVRDCLPIGDLLELAPDPQLERSASGRKRQVKHPQFAGEVCA